MRTEAQAKAIAKYEAKMGIAAKTYKLNKDIAERFKETCKKAGISQSAKLTELMRQFIEEQGSDGSDG